MSDSSPTDTHFGTTFFVWADTHFGYPSRFERLDHRESTLRQMRDLPGKAWPEPLSGVVSEPAFVLHCGDMIDGVGDPAREIALYDAAMRGFPWPHYEVMGNHDQAGAFREVFTGRYGGLSYSFDEGGMHFISLNSANDASGGVWVPADDMAFLRDDVSRVAAGVPVVLVTHCRLDAVGNGREVRDALADARVALVIAGHKHAVGWFGWEGLTCLDVGHCRDHPIDPEYARSFYVVQIGADRIQAAPWRWDLDDWERAQRWTDRSVLQSRFYLDAAL